MNPRHLAESFVVRLVMDIKGRPGLRQAWESLDVGTRADMVVEWRALLVQTFEQEEHLSKLEATLNPDQA